MGQINYLSTQSAGDPDIVNKKESGYQQITKKHGGVVPLPQKRGQSWNMWRKASKVSRGEHSGVDAAAKSKMSTWGPNRLR